MSSRALIPQHARRRRSPAALILIGVVAILVAVLLVTYAMVVAARVAGFDVVVTRGSADPSIPAGSVVVGRWVPPAEVRSGQEIIFEALDGDTTGPAQVHRVVDLERRDGRIVARTTRAGGESQASRYVLSDEVVSPVYSLRYIGYLLSILLTPLGWLLGFAVPTGTLCFLGLRRIWRSGDDPRSDGIGEPFPAAIATARDE